MNTKELSIKIAETLTYFTDNLKRRCVLDGKCRYHGETLGLKTKGCFIGALLPVKTRRQLDNVPADSIKGILDCQENGHYGHIQIPKYIKDNIYLFQKLQEIHDENVFWDETGLSDRGVQLIETIISVFKLHKKPFKHLLN